MWNIIGLSGFTEVTEFAAVLHSLRDANAMKVSHMSPILTVIHIRLTRLASTN